MTGRIDNFDNLLAAAWHRAHDRKPVELEICGIQWKKLPLGIRQRWWRETNYNRLPPSAEFMERLPQLLANEQAKADEEKQEIKAAVARAREILADAWRRQPPLHSGRVDHLGRGCAECLRTASPCQVRCLRSMLPTREP